jgi:hypothetical protein
MNKKTFKIQIVAMRQLFRRVLVPNKGRGLISTANIGKGAKIHSEYPIALQSTSKSICSNCLLPIDELLAHCCSNARFCSSTCKDHFFRLHHRILCGRDESFVMGNFPRLVDQVIARIFSSMLLQMDGELKEFEKYGDHRTDALVKSVSELCFIESWDQPQLDSIRRNYDNLIDWLKSSGKITFPGGVESLIPWSFYLRVYSACHLNTFGVHLSNDPSMNMNAVALFREASMFNHSCVPNVEFKWNPKEPAGEFFALEDISEGSELLVSYIDSFAPKEDRSKYLKGTYGFDCDCPKCRTLAE